ncbi:MULTISPECIES: HAL/PAL/TAL family ammonia-lyase [unclassified Aureimonas]|uniref:HAL/PAL/TAL family ammonia-lyase n=1 Tax=unclassified Aureimonas TaxID=2615206 RepID=UPI0006FB32FB|nr:MULTISPECIES: histidine ammonia-lyase [unclassified Aureimonas]KQT69889.1 histidine ammonia-lyase [Aureimonas sp. Leaf427]KQT75957.1 histidine ammonia-lyase [Aureimonas sp. Leaf460]
MSGAVVRLDAPPSPAEIAAVAKGARLVLSDAARARIGTGRRIVEALSERGIRGYGINTGVGALCDVMIERPLQRALSRNLVFSHACGLGEPLGREETRAIMAAEIAGFAKGASGVRLEVVETLIALLDADILPLVPSKGSVGYLTHAAAIGLVLIGEGEATTGETRIEGSEALARIGRAPLVLEAKEGLSLVNGTPCSTGLACLALDRLARLLDWSDAAAALAYENLGAQAGTFDGKTLALRRSDGLQAVGATLRRLLEGSPLLAARAGSRTQDPLSLRAVPHIHGAARDALAQARIVVENELASVTDNPAVGGTPDAPVVRSQAHAVAAALGLALDALAIAAAELASISERRTDRLVNPLVSGLPAFLAKEGGVFSGYMIAQYTASALVAENRRLAAPASLDGGITSALQEDMLTHATPAATKLLAILDNLRDILAIELLGAAQAYDLQAVQDRAPGTDALYRRIRALVPAYADDRPMNWDIAALRALLATPAFEEISA